MALTISDCAAAAAVGSGRSAPKLDAKRGGGGGQAARDVGVTAAGREQPKVAVGEAVPFCCAALLPFSRCISSDGERASAT